MKTWQILGFGLTWVALTILGCDRPSPAGKTANAAKETEKAETSQPKTDIPSGWISFTPSEKDFSVYVPENPKINRNRDTDLQKQRVYIFPKGNSGLAIYLFSDRKGSAAKLDDIQEARSNPNLVPGSLRELTLGKLKGIEALHKEPNGNEETLSRIFRSPDGTEAISLSVKNPKGFSDNEIKAFFNSFKFNK